MVVSMITEDDDDRSSQPVAPVPPALLGGASGSRSTRGRTLTPASESGAATPVAAKPRLGSTACMQVGRISAPRSAKQLQVDQRAGVGVTPEEAMEAEA